MKKILMVLAVLVFAVAAAYSEGYGSPFIASLEDAARTVDLENNGYRLDLSVPGQELSAVLQYDGEQGIAEIGLGQYDQIQLDSGKAVYAGNGYTYVLDYSKISELMQPGVLRHRMEERFGQAAAAALKYLVNPFVQYEYNGYTFSMHLDIDTRKLGPQIRAFAEELIRDESVRAAYPAAAPILREAGLWIPGNIDDLPAYLESAIPDSEYRQGRLVGDLLVSFEGGAISEAVFSGNYHYGYSKWAGTYPLYLKLSARDGRLSLFADGDTPNGGAKLVLEGNHFYFETRRHKGDSPWFSIDGTYDETTGEVKAEIRDRGREQVGWIAGTMLRDSLTLEIRYYDDEIGIYAQNGRNYIYGKAGFNSRTYEIWAGEAPDNGFSARISGFNPFTWTDDSCSLLMNRDRFEFSFFRDGNGILDVSALYDPGTNAVDITGELTDRWERVYQVHLSGAGSDYGVEFSYPYYRWRVEGKGDVRFSPGWLLQSAVFDVTAANRNAETITTYALERTVDTAGKMVYQLRKDSEVLGRLVMGLRNDGMGKAFTVSVLNGETPVFSASVVPVAKEPIIPFDTSNALTITPEMVGMLIQSLFLR